MRILVGAGPGSGRAARKSRHLTAVLNTLVVWIACRHRGGAFRMRIRWAPDDTGRALGATQRWRDPHGLLSWNA